MSDDPDGYQKMDELTLESVHEIDGFLGWECHKSSFISYWKSKGGIDEWRKYYINSGYTHFSAR